MSRKRADFDAWVAAGEREDFERQIGRFISPEHYRDYLRRDCPPDGMSCGACPVTGCDGGKLRRSESPDGITVAEIVAASEVYEMEKGKIKERPDRELITIPPRKSASTAGTAARNKGAEFERQIVRMFRLEGWPLADRTSNGRIQAARGDIEGGPEGFYWECKRQERLNIPAAFDQIRRDAPPLLVPVLIHRPSRHEIMATLPLSDLLTLAKRSEM